MNYLKFYTRVYSSLRNRPCLPNRLFSPFRYLVRSLANRHLPYWLEKTRTSLHNNQYTRLTTHKVIVSVTTFPARINRLWIVIESILRQTHKVDKIILWLSREQFASIDSVPFSLRRYKILDIRFVEADIRSHKKYYYAFQEFQNDFVILIDDDIIYPLNMIEDLLKQRLIEPNTVICRYANIISYQNHKICPFKEWEWRDGEYSDPKLFFGTGGGSLFLPSELYQDTLKMELFLKLTPLADDVWLNTMARLASLKIKKIDCGPLLPVISPNNSFLCDQNVENDQNDVQIHNIIDHYTSTCDIDPFSDSGHMCR